MKAVITSIDYLGNDPALPDGSTYSKEGQWVRFYISPERQPGDESLDFIVCSPDWLKEFIKSSGHPVIGRPHVIVHPFNLNKGVEFMQKAVEDECGEDYDVLTDRLSRLCLYEFEG